MRTWEDLDRPGPPWVVAHRGYSARYPENTLVAFEGAVQAGADALELDVRLTADGVPVVFHDGDLARTTDGTGPVASTRLAEIERLDAGAWFGRAFANQRVPHLETLLARMADRVALDLELKADEGVPPERVVRVAAAVTYLVKKLRLRSSVLISSFAPLLLEAARLRAPEIRRMVLWDGAIVLDALVATARRVGASAVGVEAAHTGAADVAALHAEGFAVLPFTADDEATMRSLLGAGVDGVMTNEVDRLRAVVGARA